MTISVTITNNDTSRTVLVSEINHSKDGASPTKGMWKNILPGESATFHIYMLRDLKVEEVEPKAEYATPPGPQEPPRGSGPGTPRRQVG